jgi:hypothetical protein
MAPCRGGLMWPGAEGYGHGRRDGDDYRDDQRPRRGPSAAAAVLVAAGLGLSGGRGRNLGRRERRPDAGAATEIELSGF